MEVKASPLMFVLCRIVAMKFEHLLNKKVGSLGEHWLTASPTQHY